MELFKWFEVEAADSASVLRFTKMQGTGNDFLVLVNQVGGDAAAAAAAQRLTPHWPSTRRSPQLDGLQWHGGPVSDTLESEQMVFC